MPTPPDTTAARLARLAGGSVRRAYRAALPALARRPVAAPRVLPCEVVAFSSLADLPEQVASIRSFLRHAGRPASFRVCSDGTHTRAAARVLAALDPCVQVVPAPPGSDPMLRKLALESSLGARPAVYADADVLFGPGAAELAGLLAARDAPAWFLQDCEPYLDRRVVTPAEAALAPVNGGFQVLLEPLDWADALGRLPADPVFHTEQTLLHVAMHRSGARALDPARYVVSMDDFRAWGDAHAGRPLALRHFTTPVRHKLWQAVARERVLGSSVA